MDIKMAARKEIVIMHRSSRFRAGLSARSRMDKCPPRRDKIGAGRRPPYERTMPDTHSLIYVSHSANRMTDDLANEMIREILATSRTRNAAFGVTGALLFSEGCFSQLLEGDKSAIETIFGSIRDDARHTDVTLLSFKPAPHQYFPEWSMAYAGISAGPSWLPMVEGLFKDPSAIDTDRLGRELLALMTTMIRQQEVDHGSIS